MCSTIAKCSKHVLYVDAFPATVKSQKNVRIMICCFLLIELQGRNGSWDSYFMHFMLKFFSICKYQISVDCNGVVRMDMLPFLLYLRQYILYLMLVAKIMCLASVLSSVR